MGRTTKGMEKLFLMLTSCSSLLCSRLALRTVILIVPTVDGKIYGRSIGPILAPGTSSSCPVVDAGGVAGVG